MLDSTALTHFRQLNQTERKLKPANKLTEKSGRQRVPKNDSGKKAKLIAAFKQ